MSSRRLVVWRGLVCAALLGLPAVLLGSDHQDTADVELNPLCDMNDVYAFPGSTAGSIVLVMTTASPIPAGTSKSFDPDKLYQIKIDNSTSRDGVEDLVLQFTFHGTGANQVVAMRGPVAPVQTGTRDQIRNVAATVRGAVGQTLAAGNVKLYAGLRDDPFFLDLEQFFRILPDRRPVTGTLGQLPATPTASCFRDPAPDYLLGSNCLAIVVELPASMLTSSTGSLLGIWGTISR